MSDPIAAQREARRRKITQNAQSRMNRLLGRPDSPETDVDSSTVTQTSATVSQPVSEDQAPSLPQGSPYNLRRRTHMSESPAPTVKPAQLDSESVSSASINREVQSVTSVTEPSTATENLDQDASSVSHTESFSTQAPRSLTQNSTNSPTQQPLSFDAKSLELLRIVACVVTSFLSRAVLRFGFGLFMVESIFLPFLAMEILFIYTIETYLKNIPMVQSKGTMMSAALMLCGIKPDLMDVYHKIMSHFAVVASDFGFYLFSFLIWNALMT